MFNNDNYFFGNNIKYILDSNNDLNNAPNLNNSFIFNNNLLKSPEEGDYSLRERFDNDNKDLNNNNCQEEINSCDDFVNNNHGNASNLLDNNNINNNDFNSSININNNIEANEKDKNKGTNVQEISTIHNNNASLPISQEVTNHTTTADRYNYGLPKQYNVEAIKKIIDETKLDDKIKSKFKKDNEVAKIEEKTSDENFSNKKKKTRNKKPKKTEEENLQKKRGRKKDVDKNNIINNNEDIGHNKYSLDNIFKKFKTNIVIYLVLFINGFLNTFIDWDTFIEYDKELIIYGKKYNIPKEFTLIKNIEPNAFVDKTSKKENLQFLKMSIKEFLSQKIKGSYINYLENANKIIIDKINEMKKDDKDFKFVFNLKLSDWLDVFLRKKEFSSFEDFKTISHEVVMEKRIEELLEKIGQKNEDDYFSLFVISIYNYERLLLRKKGIKK